MRILDIGKETVDIEINNKVYRLSGELYKDGFIALASQMALVSSKSMPMSMEKRLKIAPSAEELSPQSFVDWLKNSNKLILTELIDISEDEKNYVMNKICEEWENVKCPIYFSDDDYNIINQSRSKHE